LVTYFTSLLDNCNSLIVLRNCSSQHVAQLYCIFRTCSRTWGR